MLLLLGQTVHDQGNELSIIQFLMPHILLLFYTLKYYIDHEQNDELAYFILQSFGI